MLCRQLLEPSHVKLANFASVLVERGLKTPLPLEVWTKAMSPTVAHDQRGPWQLLSAAVHRMGNDGDTGGLAGGRRITKGRAQDHGPQVMQRALLLAGCSRTDAL